MGFHRIPNLIKRGLETLLHAKKSRNKRIIDEATAFLKHRIHQYYEAKSSLPRMQKDFENCEKQANEIEAQYHKALLFGEQSATSAVIVDYIEQEDNRLASYRRKAIQRCKKLHHSEWDLESAWLDMAMVELYSQNNSNGLALKNAG